MKNILIAKTIKMYLSDKRLKKRINILRIVVPRLAPTVYCALTVSRVERPAETLLQKSFEHRSTNKVISRKLINCFKCFWAQFIAEALGVILAKFQFFPITSLKYAGSWSLKVKICQNRKLRRPFSHAISASI